MTESKEPKKQSFTRFSTQTDTTSRSNIQPVPILSPKLCAEQGGFFSARRSSQGTPKYFCEKPIMIKLKPKKLTLKKDGNPLQMSLGYSQVSLEEGVDNATYQQIKISKTIPAFNAFKVNNPSNVVSTNDLANLEFDLGNKKYGTFPKTDEAQSSKTGVLFKSKEVKLTGMLRRLSSGSKIESQYGTTHPQQSAPPVKNFDIEEFQGTSLDEEQLALNAKSKPRQETSNRPHKSSHNLQNIGTKKPAICNIESKVESRISPSVQESIRFTSTYPKNICSPIKSSLKMLPKSKDAQPKDFSARRVSFNKNLNYFVYSKE